MPTARPARAVLARPWRRRSSTASGGLRLHPPLGQTPMAQHLSQAERGLSLRHARPEGFLEQADHTQGPVGHGRGGRGKRTSCAPRGVEPQGGHGSIHTVDRRVYS
jgi:hypothetical protein